mmetsp:Transcript_99052/g.166900  ORF Transcript_99052/g.166900 Transcript_99052/m.166900 type:complete len:203 (-) Transcript_99052:1223-1831(-)
MWREMAWAGMRWLGLKGQEMTVSCRIMGCGATMGLAEHVFRCASSMYPGTRCAASNGQQQRLLGPLTAFPCACWGYHAGPCCPGVPVLTGPGPRTESDSSGVAAASGVACASGWTGTTISSSSSTTSASATAGAAAGAATSTGAATSPSTATATATAPRASCGSTAAGGCWYICCRYACWSCRIPAAPYPRSRPYCATKFWL